MHPARERIAAVFGRGQGSGYLLAPDLVLTAAHVVGDCEAPTVIVPGGVGKVRCRVGWSRDDNRRCDVALLLAERDLVPPETAAAFEPLVWGRAYDLRAWPGAQAIGFPHVQRDGAGELDSEQVVGALKPGSNLLSGRHVLDSDHGAPAAPADGGSPWAGMSGAAVFVDGLLAGVVCADPGGWRHGRLTVTPSETLWQDFRFLRECVLAGHKPESRSLASPRQREVEVFERRLRDYIVGRSGELTIIGLTLGDGEGETWPLDAAYLSLELTGAGRAGAGEGFGLPGGDPAARSVPSPKRAEEALAGHRRVLLRGAAGSGKTTLLQWLATLTARGEVPPELGHLSGCIPLTLPLRTLIRRGELPRPEEFLAAAAGPLAGLPAAQGWATRRLTEGTALLLIDGVDEVPEADRRRTLAWLKDLLAAYPDARYVITTRPSAVREGWLADAGFTELELLPMSRGDVLAFIDRWHAAAGAAHDERLRSFRDALSAAVVAKRDLGRLATNPLMCALICALNRSRRGHLPHGRMELYRAALDLLLIRRDREREIVVGLEGPELEQAQVALLQKIAYWLIRNGRSEIEWHKAVEILERALPAMPAVAARGSAEQILRHLVVRSGLLRQPTSETLDFVHRTFQDYLGAQAAVDDWDFDVLVNHAHDDQWEDVLRMAVGHAPPRARAELLGMLLERGEKEETNRHRLRLLAAACLEQATEVDPAVRARVERAASELVPPRDTESAKALAEAGQIVLDLLPGPEGLSDEVAHAVVVTATTIGDDRAIPLLARYAAHPSLAVRAQLTWAWDRFDTEHYADAVISKLSYAEEGGDYLRFVAKSRRHLVVLRRMGGRPRVEYEGTPSEEDLRLLFTPVLRELAVQSADVFDLRVLSALPSLRELTVYRSKTVAHLDELDSGCLERLHFNLDEPPAGLEAVGGMTGLRYFGLTMDRSRARAGRPQTLSLPPALSALTLSAGRAVGVDLSALHHHPALEYLTYYGEDVRREELGLGTLPRLVRLHAMAEDLRTLREAEPLPGVTTLHLGHPRELGGLVHLPAAYPDVERLSIVMRHGSEEAIDLAPLRDLGRPVAVTVHHSGPVTGGDCLPEGSTLSVREAVKSAQAR
ncbi:hypothetical protein BLA24_14955 [Streptomyces cinnamoneus]|uniref:NACHT domain-containing protein n=1 Tax=Streptomyces cinnamoneus TaxID=53446 RepID=A0A2G1XIM7_STRCJ|nr:serine protease [Streptomyces cinnamoneus]PHQ51075.1 hypothetical protein BLA24_14955 [Streptomyces cinnamoneus]PPT13702.1 NACHT domain-containing protein [Streptomyces cinnamoneus]